MARKSYIQLPDGSLVDKEDYYQSYSPSAPMIMGDIQPYQSMATGEMITSRSHHREHLKRHGLVEIGNETKYLKNTKNPSPPPGLKETVAKLVHTKLK